MFYAFGTLHIKKNNYLCVKNITQYSDRRLPGTVWVQEINFTFIISLYLNLSYV